MIVADQIITQTHDFFFYFRVQLSFLSAHPIFDTWDIKFSLYFLPNMGTFKEELDVGLSPDSDIIQFPGSVRKLPAL